MGRVLEALRLTRHCPCFLSSASGPVGVVLANSLSTEVACVTFVILWQLLPESSCQEGHESHVAQLQDSMAGSEGECRGLLGLL